MSYELKMQGAGNGKRSRLYKKTKRASMNKIDATHLPMRVQSDKGGYWSQPSRGPAIAALEEYYNADAEKELIAATIPATEHSVM